MCVHIVACMCTHSVLAYVRIVASKDNQRSDAYKDVCTGHVMHGECSTSNVD